MPQLRKDPILGRWVIISTERGRRPSDFTPIEEPRQGGFCPFCPGNEEKTPPEVLANGPRGRSPNTPGWSLRGIPNKFPALQIEGDLDRRGEGLFDMMNGIGAHEVIVETPDHDLALADLSSDAFRKQFGKAEVTSIDKMVFASPTQAQVLFSMTVTPAGSRTRPAPEMDEQGVAQLVVQDNEVLVCSYLLRAAGQY